MEPMDGASTRPRQVALFNLERAAAGNLLRVRKRRNRTGPATSVRF